MRRWVWLTGLLTLAGLGAGAEQAGESRSYREARRSGDWYSCELRAPGVLASRAVYRARLRGGDLHAVLASTGPDDGAPLDARDFELLDEPWRRHHLQIEGWAYTWTGAGPGTRVDLGRLRRELGLGVEDALPALPPLLLSPAWDSPCRPAAPAPLERPPGVEFRDGTEDLIAAARQRVQEQRADLQALPFVVLLPDLSPGTRIHKELRAEQQGIFGGEGKAIHFDLDWEIAGAPVRVRVEESKLLPSRLPHRCGSPTSASCEHLGATPGGRELYRESSAEGPARYVFSWDGTLVSLRLAPGDAGGPSLRALRALADAFAPVTVERLAAIPDG